MGLGAECPIEHAASLGDLELVKECVEADPACANRLPDYFTWYTSTALDNAIGAGDMAVVRYLLAHGADPNLRQPGHAPRGSALLNAIAKGNMEIIDLVLEAGGGPNQEVESSGCVCGWAKEHPQLLRRLAERGGRLRDYDDLKGVDPEVLRIMFSELPLKYHVDNDDGEGLSRRLREDPGSARGIFPQTLGNRPLMDLCLQADPDLLRDLSPDVVRRLARDERLKDYSEQALALSDLSQPDWMGITELHDIAAFGSMSEAERFLAHVSAAGGPRRGVHQHAPGLGREGGPRGDGGVPAREGSRSPRVRTLPMGRAPVLGAEAGPRGDGGGHRAVSVIAEESRIMRRPCHSPGCLPLHPG